LEDFKKAEINSGKKVMKLGGSAQDKGHANEIAAFFDAIGGNANAPISIESLAATSLASFAVIESAKTGATCPIDLKLVL
jgi:hypothetical protein